MGLSYHTVNQACKIDTVFKSDFDQLEKEYTDELEAKSLDIALTNDKATLERIFQLRALRPEKYARENMREAGLQVTLNIAGFPQEKLKQRNAVIDVTTEKELDAPPDDLQITMHNSISPTVINSSCEPLTDSPTETATVPRT